LGFLHFDSPFGGFFVFISRKADQGTLHSIYKPIDLVTPKMLRIVLETFTFKSCFFGLCYRYWVGISAIFCKYQGIEIVVISLFVSANSFEGVCVFDFLWEIGYL